jgi:nucleotide-binding universal stress UspA family protein
MRKILVPTDFSENAFNALMYACQVFKYEHCEIFILHAYADEVYKQAGGVERNILEGLKSSTLDRSAHELEKIAETINDYSPNPNHRFKTLSAFGTLTDEINELVNKENMDIVVMGTRGNTDDRNITFGSNTLQVLKYVQCPVLAIPAGFTFQVPKNILFPTNYLIPYKRRELKLLCEMSDSFRAAITMLYIDPVEHLSLRQEDNMKFLKECLFKPKLNFETGPQEDKAKVILDFINKHEILLLVMVNSRHSHVEDMLYPSTIDKLGLELRIPFLVLQNLPR